MPDSLSSNAPDLQRHLQHEQANILNHGGHDQATHDALTGHMQEYEVTHPLHLPKGGVSSQGHASVAQDKMHSPSYHPVHQEDMYKHVMNLTPGHQIGNFHHPDPTHGHPEGDASHLGHQSLPHPFQRTSRPRTGSGSSMSSSNTESRTDSVFSRPGFSRTSSGASSIASMARRPRK